MDMGVKVCRDVDEVVAVVGDSRTGPKYMSSSPFQSQACWTMLDVLGRKKRASWSCGLEVMVAFQWRETCWANKRVLMSTY